MGRPAAGSPRCALSGRHAGRGLGGAGRGIAFRLGRAAGHPAARGGGEPDPGSGARPTAARWPGSASVSACITSICRICSSRRPTRRAPGCCGSSTDGRRSAATWPHGAAADARRGHAGLGLRRFRTASRCGSTSWSGSRPGSAPRRASVATFEVPPALAAEAGLAAASSARPGGSAGLSAGAAERAPRPSAATPSARRRHAARARHLASTRTRRARRSRCWRASGWRLERRRQRCVWTSGSATRGSSATASWRRRWWPRVACGVNQQIVGKTHQLVRPGDVITLTEPARVRVVRVRALGERRGPAVEARSFCTRRWPGSTEPC